MTAHLYKMLSIAEANEIVQRSISTLDSVNVDLLAATGYVLAEAITAREPLPPFPASIKVLAYPSRRRIQSTLHLTTSEANLMSERRPLASSASQPAILLHDMQDGYAVRSADGAGEYDVEFEQLAGSAPGSLSQGKVAYITTGGPSCTLPVMTSHSFSVMTYPANL